VGNYIRNPEPYKIYLVAMVRYWRHSGFQVYVGPRIQPGEVEATENLARYIILAPFSQGRMTYLETRNRSISESYMLPVEPSGKC